MRCMVYVFKFCRIGCALDLCIYYTPKVNFKFYLYNNFSLYAFNPNVRVDRLEGKLFYIKNSFNYSLEFCFQIFILA